MKIKLIFIILVFMLMSVDTLFAQQNNGFINFSFSHGIHVISSESKYASSNEWRYMDRNGSTMNIDLVHSLGLTLGLSAMHLSVDHGSYIFPVIRCGYTFAADRWCTGANVLITGKHMGFNINGTYWIIENLGFGIVFNMLFSTAGEGTIILPGLSWSIKY